MLSTGLLKCIATGILRRLQGAVFSASIRRFKHLITMVSLSKNFRYLIAIAITLVLQLAAPLNETAKADNLRAIRLKQYQAISGAGHGKLQLNKQSPGALKPATIKPVPFELNSRGELFLHKLPAFQPIPNTLSLMQGVGETGDQVQFTTDPVLQNYVQDLMRAVSAPHASIVVMDPKTGRILALADKSSSLEKPLQHSGFPAASLFKIITAAAGIEKAHLGPNSIIKYRGGNYQLDKNNYKPNAKLDRLSLTLGKAMGKSTNAVFSRVANNYLTPQILRSYTNSFGFNSDLKFDVPLRESSAYIPTDAYGFGRTAAGFGKVFLSPIHAASLMSAVANGGSIQRPHLIKQVNSKTGSLLYQSKPSTIKTAFARNTAPILMEMMTNSVTSGTSRYAFYNKNKPILGNIRVSGKTGTLRGTNPVGQNRWFIGAAPANSPEIVVVAHSINPRNSSSRPSYMASRVLLKYFQTKK